MVDRVLGVVRIDCTIFLAGFVNRNLVLRLKIHAMASVESKAQATENSQPGRHHTELTTA